MCDDFQEKPHCKRTKNYPFVCNGCVVKEKCKLPKFFYKAKTAQREYEESVSPHKKDPRVDAVQLARLYKVLWEGIKKNQSIEVILKVNDIAMAPSTAYRYIDDNHLSIMNFDFKRNVAYKQRYTNKPKAKPIHYEYLTKRTFKELKTFLMESPTANIWQLQTVEGMKG